VEACQRGSLAEVGTALVIRLELSVSIVRHTIKVKLLVACCCSFGKAGSPVLLLTPSDCWGVSSTVEAVGPSLAGTMEDHLAWEE